MTRCRTDMAAGLSSARGSCGRRSVRLGLFGRGSAGRVVRRVAFSLMMRALVNPGRRLNRSGNVGGLGQITDSKKAGSDQSLQHSRSGSPPSPRREDPPTRPAPAPAAPAREFGKARERMGPRAASCTTDRARPAARRSDDPRQAVLRPGASASRAPRGVAEDVLESLAVASRLCSAKSKLASVVRSPARQLHRRS